MLPCGVFGLRLSLVACRIVGYYLPIVRTEMMEGVVVDLDSGARLRRYNAWIAVQAWAPEAFRHPASLEFLNSYDSLVKIVNHIPCPSSAIDVSDGCWLDIQRPHDQPLMGWMERYEIIERLVRLDSEVRDCTVWIDGSKIRVALQGDGYEVDDLAHIEARLTNVIYFIVSL